MPVPAELTKNIYRLVGSYNIQVDTAANSSRASVGKQFHAYLEVDFQAKHDAKIRAYCLENDVPGRKQGGAQVVRPGNDPADIFAFYRAKGQIAAENAASEMTKKWKANKTNNSVFVREAKTILAVQGLDQTDGYGYDVSMWYNVTDIYVSFHCYPN